MFCSTIEIVGTVDEVKLDVPSTFFNCNRSNTSCGVQYAANALICILLIVGACETLAVETLIQYLFALFIVSVAQSLNMFCGNISTPSLEKSYGTPSLSSTSISYLPDIGVNCTHPEPL